MHIFQLFIEKSKIGERYMLGSYLFNKIDVGLNNGIDTASKSGVGSPDHVPIQNGEYLGSGGHQAGLYAMGMSVGMSQNLPPTK